MVRLEKIDQSKNQRRYYALTICPTLFGDWSVLREWGRLDSRGGRTRIDFYANIDAARKALASLKRRKESRGYRPISATED